MGKCTRSLLFGLVLFQCGCTRLAFDFNARPLPVECTDLDENVDAAFDSGVFCDDFFVCTEWWELFDDPQLSCLIEVGLENNPDILAAEARIRLASEEALLDRSTLYPHINFDPSAWRHKTGEFVSIPPPELEIFTEVWLKLVGTWDLDVWNKNRSLFNAALDEMRAAWADARQAELLLSTAIAAVYFDLQASLRRLDLIRQRIEERKGVLALLQERFDHGIQSEFFLYETDSEVALLQDQEQQLILTVAESQNALAALVACPACDELTLPLTAHFDHRFPLPCTLPLDLIARRPEITAQRWRIEAATYQLRAAKAAFYPNLNLLGYLSFRGFRLSKLLSAQSLDMLGEIAGHLPLFNAGELQAKFGIRTADFELAIEGYNRMVLDAVEEVSNALTALVTADARQSLISRSVQDATSLANLTEQKFSHGIADQISVLNAQINVLIQQDLAVQVQLARNQAAVALIRSIGGGFYVE